MKENKVELLAPAGSLEGFLGAIYAGADAVYVGGEKFSARAYADNLNTETLCQCIRYAHLFGRRVYLTLNTLIKEKEFSEIYDFVAPFYAAGLDGVIIQDFGVLRYLKKHFPGLSLHASTQMTITGPAIVPWCREQGISRVVPARELSLSELKAIREAGIEVECFIHGAMCYCYSGQCLMSSILGGRSGNRGRCAQPCRLPYSAEGEGFRRGESYPLSLKDMCTIDHIPELIQAGISSFKIEGRMKKSEYAAGVTAVYRKYIDLYYQHPEEPLRVTREDRALLNSLYIRSDAQDGYLFRQNGREMVTGSKPGYGEVPQKLLDQIRDRYLGKKLIYPVSMRAEFVLGKPAKLIVSTKLMTEMTCCENTKVQTNAQATVQNNLTSEKILRTNSVSDGNEQEREKNQSSVALEAIVTGPVVEQATKLPSDKEAVSRQLTKLGNTSFSLHDLEIDLEDNVFLPNGMLNQLRRDAAARLEEKILRNYFPELADRQPESTGETQRFMEDHPAIDSQSPSMGNHSSEQKVNTSDQRINEKPKYFALSVLVSTPEQMDACLAHPLAERFQYIYFTEECLQKKYEIKYEIIPPDRRVLVLPYILRLKDHAHFADLLQQAKAKDVRRLLVRNLEELGLIRQLQMENDFILMADAGLYCWNQEAKELLLTSFDMVTLPYELGSGEISALWDRQAERMIYGYIPLMQTANCLYKTSGKCRREVEPAADYHARAVLTDRFQKRFQVQTDCCYCFNTIYNSVPLSLHNKINAKKPGNYRLQFTHESAEEVVKLLDYYDQWLAEGRKPADFPCADFTTAFENRQVE